MTRTFLLSLLTAAAVLTAPAQGRYQPAEENLKNREQFQDDKFGLFIHWGIYSMMANGEWVMNNEKLNHAEYAKLASGFYPSKFDAAAWVAAAKDAGVNYITLTSRHHDGFSMFGTKQSDYNVVDATPFKRDVVKELADECLRQGIKFGVYYSHLDWGRDDYYPPGRTGHDSGRTTQGKWEDYLKFMNAQLTELLTDYGPMHQIWFDGWWDHKYAVDWKLEEQYALIHRLQPGCLVGSNHHVLPFDGEDFQMFEKDLPGRNTTGFSGDSKIGDLPLETCETMNDNWGYAIKDRNYKSTDELIQYLVKAAGNNANFLLNVGPQPNGEIPATSLERMKEIGAWMRLYGGSIYGTRGGPVPQRDWGVTTKKDGKVFVHILDLEDTALYLPITEKVKKATVFADGTPVRFTQDKDGLVLKLAAAPTEIDHVIQLEF